MSGHGPSLFVVYSGRSGGAGRFLVDIVTALPDLAVVACPPGEIERACRARGIPVVELRDRPLELRGGPRTRAAAATALAGHAREIRRLVRELEPALVFTWGMRSALAAAGLPRRGRPPWLARHHDFVPGGMTGAAVRRALALADAVVVNSQAVADDLGLQEVDVIPPGVDLERFSPAPAAGRSHVLWMGAIVGWKRPDLALEIAARTPDVPVRLAGTPLDAAGEQLLGELRTRAGGVELAGPVDPAEALRTARALLHTADREPFGIAIAEALASGVPVAAPAAGGPAEIVDDSCGRLFAPGDAEAGATALREVLDNRDALGEGARRRAEERYDLERARAQFAQLVARHRAAHEPDERAGAGLAVVTVAHDSAPELETLLASVARHLPAAQLVIADSGSQDASAEIARRHGADVIELDNVGYGTAANAGVEVVTRPVTVVLNPDVELLDSSLAELADELDQPSAPERLLVPAVVLPDGSRQDVAQHEPGTLPLVAAALIPPAVLPRRLRAALDPWRAASPRRVGWPVGACIAARTETLLRLGPFDPEIFLYAEDLDLGLRATDAGIETWFRPDARVLHSRGHATRRAFDGEPVELLARRRREVVQARRGAARARFDDLVQAVTFADRIVLKAAARRDNKRERSQLAALRAARRSP